MEHRYITFLPGGLSMRLRLPAPAFDDPAAIALAGAYLPDPSIVREERGGWSSPGSSSCSGGALSITVRDIRPTSLVRGGRNVVLNDRWRGDASLMDLLHLSYSVARRSWLTNGIYPVHAAAVGSDDWCILLVGHSGVGKTSIALRLVRDGMQMFSGNKTLLERDGTACWAVAGTRTITVTGAQAERVGFGQEAIAYCGRGAFQLGGARYLPCRSPRVRAIAMVRLNDGMQEYSVLSPTSAMHRLYPYFLDSAYADTILAGGLALYDGSVSEPVRRRLLGDLGCIAGTPVVTVGGTMNFVTDRLKELCL